MSFKLSTHLAFLATLAALVPLAAPVAADGGDDDACKPPASTCGGPVILFADEAVRPEIWPPPRECPPGHTCECVPSCPQCDDCAAQVCVPSEPECETACDCPGGLGCFEGKCIAGFAPVFCCDEGACPTGQQCQHQDGGFDFCPATCVEHLFRCELELNAFAPVRCGDDRVCSCSTSCPDCEDCGPPVCIPPGTPTPYACEEGTCARPGDACVCVTSCPGCDDCVDFLCVPDHCEDPGCQKRVDKVARKIARKVARADECESADDCVRVDTSTRCRGTCGAWVNAERSERVVEKVARLDERICGSYREDGCPYATPICLMEKPACVQGRCVGLGVVDPPWPRPLFEDE